MNLTELQQTLLHTQCPTCGLGELSCLDSVMNEKPFLWCPNCDTTIDGEGVVETA